MANRKIRRDLDLSDFREQALDAVGSTPGLNITMPKTGEVINIPHPLVVTDEQQEQIERVQKQEDLDRTYPKDYEVVELREQPIPLKVENMIAVPTEKFVNGKPAETFSVRFAKAVLGEEQHARWIAGGGVSNEVGLAWQYLTKEVNDDPKA